MRGLLAIRILIAGAVLIGALIWLVVSESRARDAGTEVTMVMEGVDPRSLLTGHFVAIQLAERLGEGESCPADLPANPAADGVGEWVALKAVGDHHRAVARTTSRVEALSKGDVAVRGEAWCAGEPNVAVFTDVGVNRFHTNQAEATAIEDALRPRGDGQAPPRAKVVMSVGEDGRARLMGLIVGEKRFDLDWFSL